MTFTYRLSVRGYELDSFGHVNNAVYVRYLEQARWEMFREIGAAEYGQAAAWVPAVIETRIRYAREARLFDALQVLSSASWDMPYLVFQQDIVREDDGKRCCRATVKVVLLQDGAPVDPPRWVLDRLAGGPGVGREQ